MIIARVRRGERVEPFDTVRRHKSGRLVHVSLTVSPLLSTNGAIIGASKISRDITDRKQAEQRINTLVKELSHRVKNQYAVILSMLRGTGRHVGSLRRIRTSHRTKRVALPSWRPFPPKTAGCGRSADTALTHRSSVSGHGCHELATNAAKYGALAKSDGRIEVKWQTTSHARLRLSGQS